MQVRELAKKMQQAASHPEAGLLWDGAVAIFLLEEKVQELEQKLATTPLAARVPDSTYESVCSKIVERYVVEKRTGGGFWPYCVRAVGGSMELFIGQKNKCDEVAQALQTACLDGAFMMKVAAPQPVAQPERVALSDEQAVKALQTAIDDVRAVGLQVEAAAYIVGYFCNRVNGIKGAQQ